MTWRILALALAATLVLPSAALAEEHGMSAAQQAKLDLLADFAAGDDADDATQEAALASVTDLRELDIGWGAIFHLLKLSAALGVDPADLLGEPGLDGEYDFGFGELRKSLTEEQLESYLGGAKNFGQLKKASKAPKNKAAKRNG